MSYYANMEGDYYQGPPRPEHHHLHYQPPNYNSFSPQSNNRSENGFYYVNPPQVWQSKPGYNNRKDSSDSGISDYSSGWNSRKTSNTSNVSHSSFGVEDLGLEDVLEEMPFDEPDQAMCQQIAQQVEFYFSDANITKDKFLLKHVKRNKEGFVSIKLISSFKRVKHLTKDWRQVAFAVETQSDKLQVNDQKNKVRRLESLPDYDETTPSRTVIAMNLPIERPTIESVAELFSACGDIVLVRILRPGNPIPADIKPFANKNPEMSDKVCALVEFECTEFAQKAVNDLHSDQGMKVMELTKPVKKENEKKKGIKLHQTNQVQTSGMPPTRRVSHAGFGQQPEQLMFGPRGGPPRRISLQHNFKPADNNQVVPLQSVHQAHSNNNCSSLNPNAPTFQMQQRQRLSLQQNHENSEAKPAGHCTWMMRKRALSNGQSSHGNNCGLTLPVNVIRMPRGPEKGKTFIRKGKENEVKVEVAQTAKKTEEKPVQEKSR